MAKKALEEFIDSNNQTLIIVMAISLFALIYIHFINPKRHPKMVEGMDPNELPPPPPMAKPPMAKPPMAKPKMAKPKMAKPKMAKPKMANPKMAKPPMARPPMAKPPMARPPMARPPMAKPKGAKPPAPKPKGADMRGDVTGLQPPLLRTKHDGPVHPFEDIDIYASAQSLYGDFVPPSMMQEYALLKNAGEWSKEKASQLNASVTDSKLPAFDPTARGGLMPSQMELREKVPAPKPQAAPKAPKAPKQAKASGNVASIEVHFVYGEWCGHSRNAKPAFESLLSEKVMAGGVPVKFVMTEDKSPGFEMFKGKVRGFPTYMIVMKDASGSVVGVDQLRTPSRSAEDIKAAASQIKA